MVAGLGHPLEVVVQPALTEAEEYGALDLPYGSQLSSVSTSVTCWFSVGIKGTQYIVFFWRLGSFLAY